MDSPENIGDIKESQEFNDSLHKQYFSEIEKTSSLRTWQLVDLKYLSNLLMDNTYLEKSNAVSISRGNYLGTSQKDSISEMKSACTEVCDAAVWHHSTSYLMFCSG